MKYKGKFYILLFTLIFGLSGYLWASEYEFNKVEQSFKNFVTCELTRTNAVNHFKGSPFKITMIDLFDYRNESGITIITGAVDCFVNNSHKTLYVAVGLKEILDKEQVLYYVIRKSDFSILATELFNYPYKERCKWVQYWLDTD